MAGAAQAASELVTAIDRVLSGLAGRLGATDSPPATRQPDAPGVAGDPVGGGGGLAQVVAAFGLTAFERDLLVLLAAIELDPRAPRLVAAALGGGTAPTFGLALAGLDGACWDALVPTAPLRAHRLLEVGAGPLTAAPLTIDERALHALCGVATLDARLATRFRPLPAGEQAPPSLAPAVAAVRAAAAGGLSLQVVEGDPGERLAVVAAALGPPTSARRESAPPAWRVLASELPRTVEEVDAFARLWEREVRLTGARLVVDLGGVTGAEDAGRADATRRLLDRLAGTTVVTAPAPLAGGPDTVVAVPRVSAADQCVLWRDRLRGVLPAEPARELADELVDRFDLGWQTLDRAATLLAAELRGGGPGGAAQRGAVRSGGAAVHAVTRPALEGLAQRIAPTATRERLVVPVAVTIALDDVVRHVRHRRRVHDDWGFDGARGRGVTALFSGPSGTGKTLAAEVVASELGLELWRVDLSVVVSKYIGETEKQLRRLLDAAEAGTVVLLFDEADALFGKRTELRDSHDRYANQEVSYLLQRLETFRGLAILTTNLRAAIDEAFLRRFRFVVNFPFPDASQRAAIWDAVVPASAPFVPVAVEHLAKLGLTGGHLHNVAVAAAVLAADSDGVVTGAHLRSAVRREYAKLGRTLTSAEDAALAAATRAGAPNGRVGGRP